MSPFHTTQHCLIWTHEHEILQIEPWGADSLRVSATCNDAIRDDLPGALLPAEAQPAEIHITETGATLRNGLIEARVSEAGWVSFHRSDTGTELLREEMTYFARAPQRWFKSLGSDLYHLEIRFQAYEGERLYGLGQQQHGRLDQKGCVVDLFQHNTGVSIPFLLSNRGYGLFWNNPGVGRVELGQSRTRWVAEATRQMDYWITAADTPAQIVTNYTQYTGRAPQFPEWAAGFWQCKLRYRTQAEVLEVAREHKRRGLPLSVIVIDYFHWTLQGDWQFDPQDWPDPAGMVRELAEMGVRVMVSVWPSVNSLSENFPRMKDLGYLVRSERGVPAMKDFVDSFPRNGRTYIHFYDSTHPGARRFIWEQVRQGYYRHGIKVYWLDACEPEIRPWDPENMRLHLGNGLEVMNIYPMLHARAFYEGMQSEGESEVINLARSAWAGSQRYGAAVWSGDIHSTFEDLQAQVRGGLNIGLSGIPWWTTDIGGFLEGDIRSETFRELMVRWFQFGVFCPLLRLHGYRLPLGDDTGAPNEVWSFGEQVYGILKEQLALRERLKPYILSLMRTASETGIPPMRPLFLEFPQDSTCYEVEDAYMFGPDVLVAPVMEHGARSRRVYLPPGIWRNAWTKEFIPGSQWLEVDAPLEQIPVFIRAGAEVGI